MEKILVTSDMSAKSKAGIKFALQLAHQFKAQLIVLYVSEVTQPTSWTNARYEQYKIETETIFTTKLKRLVAQSQGANPKLDDIIYRIELSLNVPQTIINIAKKVKASFICMSTRGAGKFAKLFGTNASAVLTASSVPVIVVPERYTMAKIDKLMFACDFAALAREIKVVSELADKLKAKTKVIHFDYLLHVPERFRKLENRTTKYINKNISFEFKKQHIENTLSENLSAAIKKEKPSLVVLFTKQDRNWYDRLLLPSEAGEIAFHPQKPLLTFKKK